MLRLDFKRKYLESSKFLDILSAQEEGKAGQGRLTRAALQSFCMRAEKAAQIGVVDRQNMQYI